MALDLLPPPAAPVTASTREIRVLTDEEVASYVAPQYAETGNQLPDPAISCFVGVVEDGEVLAFLGLQLKLHAQPMWIKPGHQALFQPLVHAAEQVILERTGSGTWVYLFAPAGKLSQLAQAMGMQL